MVKFVSFYFCVPDRKKETLEAILLKYVRSNTVIFSDSWKAYSKLSEKFAVHC